ncbi:MAG: adenylate/guanylate cyclase domain-containing protein [Aestuariivirga sp.]
MKLRPALKAILFGVTVVTLLVALRWADFGTLRSARDFAFDQFQRLAPRAYEPTPVRIIDIDERALKNLGQWPWPRTLVAKLSSRLNELGAAVVAFDILFAEPDRLSPKNIMAEQDSVDPAIIAGLRDNDTVLAAQFAQQPVVLGFATNVDSKVMPKVKAGFAFTGESPLLAPPPLAGTTPPLSVLEDAAAGIGDISMNAAADSTVVRTISLFRSDGKQLYPSLVMEALRVAQGASTYIIANAPEREGSIATVRVGDFEVPTTSAGELQIYTSPERADRYVSASDVLSGDEAKLRPLIEGNIVLVGTSSAGLLDIRTTTLGQNVPGVSLHAQAIEQILTRNFLNRPDWADGLEVIEIALLGLAVVLLTALVSPWIAVTTGTAVAGAALLASWLAFRNAGLLIDPTYPVATALVSQFAVMGFRFLTTDQERRHIRKAFSQHVSPAVLARAENQPEAMLLGGVDREITLMFMDIRDFTTISEGMPPTDLVSFLNKLLSGLSRHVMASEGTLDKFIGDSIMAFWNAPVDIAEHPVRAALCALAMRDTLREMNEQDALALGRPLAIGIGLNTGIACVGNMGAESRFNYSAVGDAVNTTARIEAASKDLAFDILVSASTAEKLKGFAMLDAGSHALKGKSERIRLFLLLGDAKLAQTPGFQKLHEAHAKLLMGLSSANAKILRAEAIDAASSFRPDLKKFYDRLSAGSLA